MGITGASGSIYGIRLLEVLRSSQEVETHLIITEAGYRTIQLETNWKKEAVEALATCCYDNGNIGASLSSGSFKVDAMVVAPCSIKSLSAIANSFNVNLLIRAADVTLKEKRPLILLVRETPLHLGHLRLMTSLCERGAIIMPPVPAFYHKPQSIDDIVNHTLGKVLDLLKIDHDLFKRWSG